MWRTVFPKQGAWQHLKNLADIGNIFLWLLDNYKEEYIQIISICGNRKPIPDMRKWVINSQEKANRFQIYCQNVINTDNLKIRVRIREAATAK